MTSGFNVLPQTASGQTFNPVLHWHLSVWIRRSVTVYRVLRQFESSSEAVSHSVGVIFKLAQEDEQVEEDSLFGDLHPLSM